MRRDSLTAADAAVFFAILMAVGACTSHSTPSGDSRSNAKEGAGSEMPRTGVEESAEVAEAAEVAEIPEVAEAVEAAVTRDVTPKLSPPVRAPDDVHFVGPFSNWADLKRDYGAVGDGVADDTAAWQKALDDLRVEKRPRNTLYVPAGTYLITQTIKLLRTTHHQAMGISILGEDPERTILLWGGEEGGIMFHYNPWFARMGRLTLDGAGKAKTAIEHGVAFTTADEFSDLIIKDVAFGIEAGMRDGIAETAVLRCRFYRCSKAALSMQNFNTLDWYIWDSWFEDCGIGATNEFGAGNFHVYYSTFLRSVDADITIRHTGYFSFIGNVSVGSRRFFHAKRAGNWKDTETWGSQGTLQDNYIIDPTDATPIVIENNGPNMLLDNIIRAKGAGPIVVNTPPADKADLIVLGNRWTSGDPLKVNGRVTDLDNQVVKASAIADAKPVPVPFAPHSNAPVIEVASGANAAGIQAAINQAVALKGKRPIVHLPTGQYSIGTTLLIPPGCDLQLVGDGAEGVTELVGTGVDPVIRVQGPSHASFNSFLVKPGNNAVGILVEDCDQPGSRVFAEQIGLNGFEYGLVTDGLKEASVELRDACHNGIQVIGGGPGTKSWLSLFAGSSSRQPHHKEGGHLYDIQQEGRLFVRDIWYEGHAWSLMNLTGSGEFAYHCGFVAPGDRNHLDRTLDWEKSLRQTVAALQFENFRGKLAFTLVSTNGGPIRVKAPSPELKLYLLGFTTNEEIDLGGAAVEGTVVAEHVKVYRKNNTGLDAVESTGKATPEFIREMLTALRTVKPQPLTVPKSGVTDVRFHRVWSDGRIGMLIQASGK